MPGGRRTVLGLSGPGPLVCPWCRGTAGDAVSPVCPVPGVQRHCRHPAHPAGERGDCPVFPWDFHLPGNRGQQAGQGIFRRLLCLRPGIFPGHGPDSGGQPHFRYPGRPERRYPHLLVQSQRAALPGGHPAGRGDPGPPGTARSAGEDVGRFLLGKRRRRAFRGCSRLCAGNVCP